MDRTPAHVADMLQFVQELRALAEGQPLQVLVSDRVLCLAVEKLFINLGEAARRIDPAQAGKMPGVAWAQIIGLRNILAHGYEQVEHEVLFRSIAEDLPPLQRALEAWLSGYRA